MWKKFWASFGVLAAVAVSSVGSAEGYYYGGDPYGGMYNTGGYNLYNFGQNLYDTSSYLYGNYGYDTSSYGGGCGSFYSSCSGGYDLAGLYGSNYGSSPYLMGGNYGSSGISIDININILSSLISSMTGGYGSSFGGYGSSLLGDCGCLIGYCSSGGYGMPYLNSGYPYYGDSSYYGNNYYGGSSYYGGNNYYNYGLPGYTSTIDVNISNPWTNYQPPVYTPPYNGCGLGSYTCPTGPVTRIDPPVYYPPTYSPPSYPPSNPVPPRTTPPTHTPGNPTIPPYVPPTYVPPTTPTNPPGGGTTNQYLPTPPNRYRVPRG